MVKDLLVYITVLAAIIIIPTELGGYGKIFAAVPAKQVLLPPTPQGSLGAGFAYVTLALGSLLALFLYPHSVTGLLSSSSRHVIRRNAMVLPAYSVALALIALLGYMALAVGREGACRNMPQGFKSFGNNFAVPALFLHMFPGWFAGFAFAAIAIGALMPASIMAIACGNLFTRNIFKEFIAPGLHAPDRSARSPSWWPSLAKLGALFFVLELQTTYAIQLQLLGGIWICQTVPAVLLALYVRLDPRALLAGWAVGVGLGTWMVVELGFKSSTYPLHILGVTVPCYAAVSALVANLAVSWLLTLVLRGSAQVAMRRRRQITPDPARRGHGRSTTASAALAAIGSVPLDPARARCAPQLSAKPAGDVLLGSLVIRRGEDLLGRAIFDQLAQIHEGGIVAGARRLLHVVGDDHDGVVGRQFLDQFLDLGGGDRIQRRAGLVQQDHFGPRRHAAGDAQALLLAARQRQAARHAACPSPRPTARRGSARARRGHPSPSAGCAHRV